MDEKRDKGVSPLSRFAAPTGSAARMEEIFPTWRDPWIGVGVPSLGGVVSELWVKDAFG